MNKQRSLPFLSRYPQSALNKRELLEQEYPHKDGKDRERSAENDELPGKFTITAHLLGHSKGGDGGRRTEYGQESDEFNAAETQQHAEAYKDQRHDQELTAHADEQLLSVTAHRLKDERSAQDYERKRGSDAGEIGYSVLQDTGQLNSAEQYSQA